MRRLKILLLVLCGWLFLFYNIERISEPINLASFVYLFLFLSAAAIVLIPPLYRWPFYSLLVLVLPLYFLLKYFLEYPIAGRNLPITVTEITAIVVTMALTRYIMQQVSGLYDTVSRLTLDHLKQELPFQVGQGLMYREIRRARHNERPLAVLSIQPTEESVDLSLDRFFKDAQQEILRRYVDARVADLLLQELADYDLVTQRDGHFIALLTEAEANEVERVVQHLKDVAAEELGVQFKIGMSFFPTEAVTFEQLLTDAERKMDTLPTEDELSELEQSETSETEEAARSETQPILPI